MEKKQEALIQDFYISFPHQTQMFFGSLNQLIECPEGVHLSETKAIGNRFILWLESRVIHTKYYFNIFFSELLDDFSALFSSIKNINSKQVHKYVFRLKNIREHLIKIFSTELALYSWRELSELFEYEKEKKIKKSSISKNSIVKDLFGIDEKFEEFVNESEPNQEVSIQKSESDQEASIREREKAFREDFEEHYVHVPGVGPVHKSMYNLSIKIEKGYGG